MKAVGLRRWTLETRIRLEQMMAFRQDNHYVARLYLKRFSSEPGHVFTYRILVADRRVPLWEARFH